MTLAKAPLILLEGHGMPNKKTQLATTTQDRLIERFFESQSEMSTYLANLNRTLESINDNNVLHSQSFQAVLTQNTQAIKDISTATQATSKIFRNILYLLVLAIIVLAGVEKLPQVMGLF